MKHYIRRWSASIAVLLACFITANQAQAQPLAWSELAGPEGGTVLSIAAGQGLIYVGMTYGSVFRSTDGGISWRRTATPPAPLQEPAALGVTSGGDLFAATNNGSVYRSTNQGDSWLAVQAPWKSGSVPTLAIGTNDQIFLGSDWGSFYRSTDLGTTWITVDSIADVTTIAPISPNETLVGGTTGWYNGTIYRSTDQGTSWHEIHRRSASEAITGIARVTGVLIAGTGTSGIIRSTDDGATWSESNRGLGNLEVQRLVPIDATTAVAITKDGPFISRNQGQIWTPLNWNASSPLPGTLVPIGNGILLAGIPGRGLRRFTLSTEQWEEVNTGLRAQEITALLPMPNGRIVAGTITGEIQVSTDDGRSWHESSAPTVGRRPSRLAGMSSGHLLACSYVNLLRSPDNGESWNAAPLPSDVMLAVAVSTLNVAVVATQNRGFQVSSDDGQTWRQMRPQGDGPSDPVTTMAFGTNGHLVVATYGGEAGVYTAIVRDDTLQWISFRPIRYVRALTVAPDGTLYCADQLNGLFSSSTGGESWMRFVTPSDSSVTALLATKSGDLIAGTELGNIWHLYAGSKQWINESDGMVGMPISVLTTDADGSILAGTLGGGILTSRISLSAPETSNGTGIHLLFAGPNPVRGVLELRFELAHDALVSIVVSDVLGQIVGPGWSGGLDRGLNSVKLDLSSLPSGSYRVGIVSGENVMTEGITLVR